MTTVATMNPGKRKRDISFQPVFSFDSICCNSVKKSRTSESTTTVKPSSKEHIFLEESSELPDLTVVASPDDYLIRLVKALCGISIKTKPGLELQNFFPEVSEQQMASYTTEVAAATRQNDIDTLKQLCCSSSNDDDESSSSSSTLNCANRFGETLLHIACRRGYKDMVQFLLDQPEISTRVIDDVGRTPLHDACWNPNPQLEICQWIIEQDPSLFLIKDKRGFTPFQYARPEHWRQWRQFLFDNQECLKSLTDSSLLSRFT